MKNALHEICIEEAKDQQISANEAAEIYNQIQSELIAKIVDESGEADREVIDREMSVQEASMDNERIACVCPLCQKERLVMSNSSVIECRNFQKGQCAFKIDVSRSTIRDLDELATRLQLSAQQHPCDETPKFLFDFIDQPIIASHADNSNSLIMYCEKCRFMQSIL